MLAIVQLALWLWVVSLSRGFAYEIPFAERPMLGVVALLFALSIPYLLSIRVVWKAGANGGESRQLLWSVWGMAILLRIVLLWSHPVQEIDYYRYLWDGRALSEGVSPYAHSPAAIDAARTDPDSASPSLRSLVAVIDRSPQIATVFERIDHRAVPSIYPPMAQAVFMLSAFLTPEQATVGTAINIFRGIIITIDLLVILCITGLLKLARMPRERVVAYALCPLVLKEFANSAHMDVIAIAFLTGALWLAGQAGARATLSKRNRPSLSDVGATMFWAGSILVKFFPIILAPLLWSYVRRRLTLQAQLILALTAASTIAFAYFLIPATPPVSQPSISGLSTFASQWEINDLAFSVVHENVRLEARDQSSVWYSFVPNSWRQGLSNSISQILRSLSIDPARAPFLIAQCFSAALISVVALGLAFRPWVGKNPAHELFQRVFWTLATLWYFSATQNPWYWAWVLPFAVFVHRAWLLVSIVALVYYLRFWLIGNYPQPTFFGDLNGRRFFDEVIVWVQHAPLLVLLVIGLVRQLRKRGDEFC